MCQREAKECLDSPQRHDYLMYLGGNLAVLAEQLAGADLATFERWRREFMGGRRACDPLDEC